MLQNQKKIKYILIGNEKLMTTRNKGLDIARFIMAFCVVCIHLPFSGTVGGAIMTMTRAAVPFFFIVSGYFIGDITKKHNRIKKQLVAISKITIIASLLYIGWYTFLAYYQNRGVKNYFSSTFSVNNLLKWLFFNETPIAFHLWYLYAYIYVLLIVRVIGKLLNVKKVCVIIPCLLSVDLIFGKYSLLLFNREFPVYYTRNFLFVGLPFFLLGYLIAKDIRVREFTTRIKSIHVIIALVVSIVEYSVLTYLNVNATRDHYIGTDLLVFAIFSVALNYSTNSKTADIIANMGRKYSLTIYIIQVIWINIMTSVVLRIPTIQGMYKMFGPAIVFCLSLLTAIVIDVTKGKFVRVTR